MKLFKSKKEVTKSTIKTKNLKTNKKSNYLGYIKNNKYKFFTGGLLISGGLTYVKYNKIQSQKIYDRIKNDKELQNKLSNIGSDIVIKVVDKYIKDVTQYIPTSNVQDAIANVVVPKELLDNPQLLNPVNRIITKNAKEIDKDVNTIRNIEKYLINKGIINSSCSKYNTIPGDFPCEEDQKNITYETVLKYLEDDKLLKQVNDYITEMLLKDAEKFLLDEKKIQDGCTKFNKAWFYSEQCKNQKEADELIQNKLNELLKK